jgi:serine/threonine protein kinase
MTVRIYRRMGDRADAETRVGSTIDGAWRLERLIGCGGMASVYAATHRSGRRAAFKILHRRHVDNDELRARFVDEIRVAALIDHPDRVRIHGASTTDDGVPVLVMELLEGETLAARWRRVRRLVPRRAVKIAIALLDQVAACHARDIIHRDLKPENVFCGNDGRVRLLDFGTARRKRSSTGRRLAIGTPEFMPPEQARGHRTLVDARSDVFAVGAILWSVLSGYSLRHGRNDDEMLHQAATEPVRSLALVAPDVPQELVAIVDRALHIDPEGRWPTALAMKEALEAVLPELPERPSFVPMPALQDQPTAPSVPPRGMA